MEQCNTKPEPFVIALGERRNAAVEVHIAADEMQAQVLITPAQGGGAISASDITLALTEAGVVFGIDEAALLRAATPGSPTTTVVAQGTLPLNGKDAVFEELITQAVDRTPKVDETGHIDYREHGSIEIVSAGTALMRRHPATPGTDGHTVRGTTLPARPGRDEPFASSLAGVQCSGSDPNILEATAAGQAVLVKHGVMVEPLLHVDEVNMAVGNIHFDGSVEVKGDVVQGMLVQASGDIVVGGMVDGGILEAGGSIRIAGGVIAHAQVRAGGAVSARFAQAAQIQAGTVLALADMAMECELESLNQIIIGGESHGKGRLVGGSATAMLLLSVPLLGSAKGAVTRVVMGANAALIARYAALEERIAHEKANEEALEKLVKQTIAAKDPKGMLPRIQASQQHAVQVWGQSLAEKQKLEEEIALGLTAKVRVGTAVDGAADLVFGKHIAHVRREFSAGAFYLEPTEHVVVFEDTAGHVVPVH